MVMVYDAALTPRVTPWSVDFGSYSFVMTKVGSDQGERRSRCRWCRRVLPTQTLGRPRQFCSQACRQWDWVGRQRARELQLSEDELIVTKAELDQLHDELYVLACAVDDVDRDRATAGKSATPKALSEMLAWLLEAARPIRDRELRT
jgi:hypothetical protein